MSVSDSAAPVPQDSDRALIVSSDGHATARMRDYRPYIPAGYLEEFDAFCELHDKEGTLTVDAKSLSGRLDPEIVADWVDSVITPGRLAGQSDVSARLAELDREGIAAEVIFPDFGLPFELHSALRAAILGAYPTSEQVAVAHHAYNRWLVDFCGASGGRLGGLAVIKFADVDKAVAEIRWARENGLVGVVLPTMPEDTPLFHERHEPIWSVLEELNMPVCSHTAISSVTDHTAARTYTAVPHPACAIPLMTAQVFFNTQQVFAHLIWGGVLERHPRLRVVLTEQGSGWVISALRAMDYTWEQSYLRRDVREIVKRRPSEYFERQVFLGSSLFSRAEAEARLEIGIHKICLGMDYPHHEGMWAAGPGTTEWLRATLGVANVTTHEARLMLGENALRVWDFDPTVLSGVAASIGPSLRSVLRAPDRELFPRGDVNKPLTAAF